MTEQEKRQLKLSQQIELMLDLLADINDNVSVIQDASYTLTANFSNAIGSISQVNNLLNNQVVAQGNHGSNLNLIRVLP